MRLLTFLLFSLFFFKAHVHPDCCAEDLYWFNAEYLYWKVKDSPKVIPLVIESADIPVFGQIGTLVVLGDEKGRDPWRSGGRFSLGYWFEPEERLAVEGVYFILEKQAKKQGVFSNGSIGSNYLSIPFFDVTSGLESTTAIARPSSFSGKATYKVSNFMQGAELNGIAADLYECPINLGFLGGLRFWNFVEHVSFKTNSPFVPPNPPDVFRTEDHFHVNNNFYGGQLGALLSYEWNRYTVNLKGKVALGAMCESINIHGHLRTNDFNGFGQPRNYDGGYFALPSNSGHRRSTRFAVIPEVNLDALYQINDCFSFSLGYTFLYVSNMIYATNQLESSINPTQSAAIENLPNPTLVGEARPKSSLKNDSLWVQGVSVGFQYVF